MASLPCNLKGQTVCIPTVIYILYCGVEKEEERLALFCSIFKSSFSTLFLIYIKDALLFNCVNFDEATAQLLSCTSGVFVISFSIDMHQ